MKQVAYISMAILGISQFISSNLFAAYYDVVPKGRRMVFARQLMTNKVESVFDHQGSNTQLENNFSLDSKSLAKNETLKEYFEYLKKHSIESYNKFTLGEYHIDGNGQVEVFAFGIAYGLTNKISLYSGIPFYKADVQVDLIRTRNSNTAEIGKELSSTGGQSGFKPQVYQQLTSEFPDGNESLIQSAITNHYQYEPLGDWHGEGFGDLEVGAIYQIAKSDNAGSSAKLGLVVPTGRIDDPDILQDIAFGDGQFDTYLELGAGVTEPTNKNLEFWTAARYTHQFASKKELRIAQDESGLSSEKGIFKEKLGNKIDFMNGASYRLNDWSSLGIGYIYNYQFKSKYESEHSESNAFLEKDSSSYVHKFRGGIALSSIERFFAKKFLAPMTFTVNYEKTFYGKNTPKYALVDIELRLFF